MKHPAARNILAIVLLLCGALLCSPPAAAAPVNIAPNCNIGTSPLPNALWSEDKAVDNNTGTTMGWLGLVGGPKDKPWLYFAMPSKTTISAIELLAASFKETGPNRFSRPKEVIIDFVNNKKASRLTFEMKDSEKEFQKFEFSPVQADAMRITIDSVYSGGAKIADMAGFMEVRIYSPDGATAANSTDETNSGDGHLDNNEEASETASEDNVGGGEGKLSADEKEILDLLRELIAKLENKFRED